MLSELILSQKSIRVLYAIFYQKKLFQISINLKNLKILY